jgi:hypothetical protein
MVMKVPGPWGWRGGRAEAREEIGAKHRAGVTLRSSERFRPGPNGSKLPTYQFITRFQHKMFDRHTAS